MEDSLDKAPESAEEVNDMFGGLDLVLEDVHHHQPHYHLLVEGGPGAHGEDEGLPEELRGIKEAEIFDPISRPRLRRDKNESSKKRDRNVLFYGVRTPRNTEEEMARRMGGAGILNHAAIDAGGHDNGFHEELQFVSPQPVASSKKSRAHSPERARPPVSSAPRPASAPLSPPPPPRMPVEAEGGVSVEYSKAHELHLRLASAELDDSSSTPTVLPGPSSSSPSRSVPSSVIVADGGGVQNASASSSPVVIPRRKLNAAQTAHLVDELRRWVDDGVPQRIASDIESRRGKTYSGSTSAAKVASAPAPSSSGAASKAAEGVAGQPVKKKRGRPSKKQQAQAEEERAAEAARVAAVHTQRNAEYEKTLREPNVDKLIAFAKLPHDNLALQACLSVCLDVVTDGVIFSTIKTVAKDLHLKQDSLDRVIIDMGRYFRFDLRQKVALVKHAMMTAEAEAESSVPENRSEVPLPPSPDGGAADGGADGEAGGGAVESPTHAAPAPPLSPPRKRLKSPVEAGLDVVGGAPSVASAVEVVEKEKEGEDEVEEVVEEEAGVSSNVDFSHDVFFGDDEGGADGSVVVESEPVVSNKEEEERGSVSSPVVSVVDSNVDVVLLADVASSVAPIVVSDVTSDVASDVVVVAVAAPLAVAEKPVDVLPVAQEEVVASLSPPRQVELTVEMDYSDPERWAQHPLPPSLPRASLESVEDSSLFVDQRVAVSREEGCSPQFLREVLSLKTVCFPHLQMVRDVSVDASLRSACLVFRRERRLSEVVSSGVGFSFDMFKALCRGMFGGLYYLHNLGLFHRNFCMPHVIYTEQHEVRLADWWHREAISSSDVLAAAPPERVMLGRSFGELDATADVWSVGVVMASVMLGRPLFQGNTGDTLMTSMVAVLGVPEESEYAAIVSRLRVHAGPSRLEGVLGQARIRDPKAVAMVRRMLAYATGERMSMSQIRNQVWMREEK